MIVLMPLATRNDPREERAKTLHRAFDESIRRLVREVVDHWNESAKCSPEEISWIENHICVAVISMPRMLVTALIDGRVQRLYRAQPEIFSAHL